MATSYVDVDRISGTPRTVRELFSARTYGLDYYQREYSWQESQIVELLDDLCNRFLTQHEPDHARDEVAAYRPYFLGPIVTNNRGGTLYVVDGQQRLTTLTLLLIHLLHVQDGRHDAVEIAPLVYTVASPILALASQPGLLSSPAHANPASRRATRFGRQAFNLDIDQREPVMRTILHRGTFDHTNAPPSLRNLWRRFQDIERLFPADLQGPALPYFVDWLLERVMVVEISTGDPDLALEIFETMNDRGLRLSMTDMLKGYLLSRIGRSQDVDAANDLWRRRLGDLVEADRNADADFFKHWLRAKYADTIRERRKDAVPGDFDVIGTAFHKWVRDHDGEIGLRKPGGVQTFVHRDFERLSRRYLQLLGVSQTFTPGFESVFYNACTDFTLQYQTILAAVTPVDDEEVSGSRPAWSPATSTASSPCG